MWGVGIIGAICSWILSSLIIYIAVRYALYAYERDEKKKE